MDYGKIEWYCGIKSFTCEYFSLLKKILKYSLVKVIPEYLVSSFFEKEIELFLNFQFMFSQTNTCIFKFECTQILTSLLIQRLYLVAFMFFLFGQKIVAIFGQEK